MFLFTKGVIPFSFLKQMILDNGIFTLGDTFYLRE